MRQWQRIVLLIELGLGFGKITILWAIVSLFWIVYSGFIMFSLVQVFIEFALGHRDSLDFSALLLWGLLSFCVVLGGYGLIGMWALVRYVLWSKVSRLSPQQIKRRLIAGVVDLVSSWIALSWDSGESWKIIFIVALPLLVTCHFVYLGRSYLWSKS